MTIKKVQEFHDKFGLPNGDSRDQLIGDSEAIDFRIKFLQEELDELTEALKTNDRVKAFDALLDLEYVVHGTALFMGVDPVTWSQGADAVHTANMAKERATSRGQSKRGTTLDVIKPEGWVGPEKSLQDALDQGDLWTKYDSTQPDL